MSITQVWQGMIFKRGRITGNVALDYGGNETSFYFIFADAITSILIW